MRVDQKELARFLGINRVTLSRALNDSPRVSSQLKERVREACQVLGYRPNYYARSLVRRQTKIISVLCTGLPMADLHNRWVGEIQGQVLSNGYKLRLDSGIDIRDLMAEGAADGYIYFGSPHDLLETFPQLDLYIVPVVFIDCIYDASIGMIVSIDNSGGVRSAVDYLVSIGHRRMAFFGYKKRGVAPERYKGFCEGLQAANLDTHSAHTIELDSWPWTVEDTFSHRHELNNAIDTGVTAVVTSSDISAVGVIKMLRSRGLCVPSNISVIGFDDSTLAQAFDPRLTCVSQDIREAAVQAVKMLIESILTREVQESVLIKSSLCIRESSAAPDTPPPA